MREDLRRAVETQIAAATAGWREQKLVDIETAEAVVARLQNWAKFFGFFVAIPLGLIAIWLGLLGYNTYTGLNQSIANAKSDVDKKIVDATATLNSIQPKVRTAEDQVGKLADRNRRLSESQARIILLQQQIGPRLNSIAGQVSKLQNRAADLDNNMGKAEQIIQRVDRLSEQVTEVSEAQQAVNVRSAYVALASSVNGPDSAKQREAVSTLRRILAAAGYSPPSNADGRGLLADLRRAMSEAASDSDKLAKLSRAITANVY